MQFRVLISEAAQKDLIFFCLNNHRKSLFCFKQTRDLFLHYGRQKFVIQDQFTEINSKVIQLVEKVKNNIQEKYQKIHNIENHIQISKRRSRGSS